MTASTINDLKSMSIKFNEFLSFSVLGAQVRQSYGFYNHYYLFSMCIILVSICKAFPELAKCCDLFIGEIVCQHLHNGHLGREVVDPIIQSNCAKLTTYLLP